jgi:hypothetical protein
MIAAILSASDNVCNKRNCRAPMRRDDNLCCGIAAQQNSIGGYFAAKTLPSTRTEAMRSPITLLNAGE